MILIPFLFGSQFICKLGNKSGYEIVKFDFVLSETTQFNQKYQNQQFNTLFELNIGVGEGLYIKVTNNGASGQILLGVTNQYDLYVKLATRIKVGHVYVLCSSNYVSEVLASHVSSIADQKMNEYPKTNKVHNSILNTVLSCTDASHYTNNFLLDSFYVIENTIVDFKIIEDVVDFQEKPIEYSEDDGVVVGDDMFAEHPVTVDRTYSLQIVESGKNIKDIPLIVGTNCLKGNAFTYRNMQCIFIKQYHDNIVNKKLQELQRKRADSLKQSGNALKQLIDKRLQARYKSIISQSRLVNHSPVRQI